MLIHYSFFLATKKKHLIKLLREAELQKYVEKGTRNYVARGVAIKKMSFFTPKANPGISVIFNVSAVIP